MCLNQSWARIQQVFIAHRTTTVPSIFRLRRAHLARFDLVWIDGELLGLVLGLTPQIVDARLEPPLPPVKVHRSQRLVVGVFDPQVEALRLADERPPVRRHVDELAHRNLPDDLVLLLNSVGDALDLLDAPPIQDDVVLQLLRPEPQVDELAHQVLVHDGELAGERATAVDVACEGLEALVVSQNLRRGCGGHRRHEERVAQSVRLDARFQCRPFIARARRAHAPHIELERALRRGRPLERVVRTERLRQLARALERAVVDGLENAAVHVARLLAVEGDVHQRERVGEPLDADAHRAVAHIAHARLVRRVKVHVDHLVEILRDHLGHGVEQLVVEGLVVLDEGAEGDARQVAHRRLPRVAVLHNLAAEVRRLDGAKVLLVALAVGGVLVEQVGVARLHLRVEDLEPERPRVDRLVRLALRLVPLVERLELVAAAIGEPRALVGAKERPLAVALDALHKEVGHPERVKEVAGAHLLVAVVLLELEEVRNIRMPRLEVDGERAVAPSALVHVARRAVEVLEHRHEPGRGAVGAADARAGRPDVVHVEPDAAGALRDAGAILQRVVDAVDAVVLHRQEVARAQLRAARAGVEERRRGVRKIFLRGEVVGLLDRRHIVAVDADGDAQPDVLRAFDVLAVTVSHKVGLLERLEAKIVDELVTLMDEHQVELDAVALDG